MSSRVNWKKFLSAVLIGSVITTAIVVISIIIFGQLGRFELRVIMSALTAVGVSVLALLCAPQIEHNPWPAKSGMIFAGLAFILTLWEIWTENRWSYEFWRYVASSWVISIAFAYISGLLSREIVGWVVILRKVSNVVILLLAGIVVLFIFDPDFLRKIAGDTRAKIMGVLAVIAAANALIILISSWMGNNSSQ